MSVAPNIVLKTLAAGGQRASVVASVICRLVIEGAELGALDDIEVVSGADGKPRTVKTLPREWLARLARAIELGVFDKPGPATMRKVVARILAPPLPENPEI